jgi:hypothetical protein
VKSKANLTHRIWFSGIGIAMSQINVATASTLSGLKISASLPATATETPLPPVSVSSSSSSAHLSTSSLLSSYAQPTDVLYSLPLGSEKVFTGPYASTRSGLDYSYHANYLPERQAIQDTIISRFLSGGVRISSSTTLLSSNGREQNSNEEDTSQVSSPLSSAAALTTQRSEGPWLVYTAGAMGAGKSHTLRYLSREGLFPLDRFIVVDPDMIKGIMPDTPHYIRHNRAMAGTLTHRESGFIAEIIIIEAMRQNKCLVVDGSLRDRNWYASWFGRVRAEFPQYRIAILMITASRERIYARAEKRAAITAREVKRSTIDDAIEQVPISFAALAPLVDFAAVISNEDDKQEPKLQGPLTWESFKSTWSSVNRARMTSESEGFSIDADLIFAGMTKSGNSSPSS